MAFIELRVLRVGLLGERGTPEQAPDLDELVDAARETGLPASIALAFAAAAQLLLAQGRPEQADTLLRELDQLRAGCPRDSASQAPPVLRIALALDDAALAERFVDGVDRRTPLFEHALASARAQLTEAAGEHAAAAGLYQRQPSLAGVRTSRARVRPARPGPLPHALANPRAEQPLAGHGNCSHRWGTSPPCRDRGAAPRE